MPKTQKNRVINQLEAVKGLLTTTQGDIEDGKAGQIVKSALAQAISSLNSLYKDIADLEDSDGNISTEHM